MAVTWSPASGECPAPELLDDLFEGSVDPRLRGKLEAHVDDCDECREFVAALARFGSTGAVPARPELAQTADIPDLTRPTEGSQLGRYTVLRALGAGAMGVVHEGYDGSLERQVAMKFIRGQLAGSSEARARVFAEAKAMARVSHQNVAQVYEAVADGERLFIVMEFVDGPTLTGWLHDEKSPRSTDSIVEVFIAAGRGLSAAHEAGVVHRDFKPDNVILTASGEPKVVDFGLAGTTAMPSRSKLAQTRSSMTVSGVGTPLFMAPEVLGGGSATTASDQFSFCVALHVALYGAQPFKGATFVELQRNVAAGLITSPTGEDRSPSRVRRAILRGLSVRPEDRWPSMADLVDALRESKRARTRRRLSVAGGAIAVGAAALGAAAVRQAAPQCSGFEASLQDVWADPLRSTVTHRLQSFDVAFSQRTAEVTVDRLDDYAERWVAARRALCELAAAAGESGAGIEARTMTCLEDARLALGATATFLSSVESGNADAVAGAVDSLPRLERCNDVEALVTDPPLPATELRENVAAVRERLAASRAARGAGAIETAKAALSTAENLATNVDYPPLRVELGIARGWSYHDHREPQRALAEFVAALRASVRSGNNELSMRAAAGAASVLDFELARADEARVYAQLHRDFAELDGDHRGKVAAELLLCKIENDAGDLDAALGHVDAALELQAVDPHADILQTSDIHAARGETYGRKGDLQAAEAAYLAAVQLDTEVLGPDHPRVAMGYKGLAAVFGAFGRFDDSLSALREAQRITEASYAPGSRENTAIRQDIGVVHLGKRDYAAAEPIFRRLIAESTRPANHPEVVGLHRNLAMALMGLDRNQEAATEAEVALAGVVQLRDPEHLEVATAKEILGGALGRSGLHARAAVLYDEVIETRTKQLSASHPDVLRAKVERSYLRGSTAGLALAQRELEADLEALERTLSEQHPYAIRAHEVLAGVLHKTGQLEAEEAQLRIGLGLTEDEPTLQPIFRVRLAANLLDRSRLAEAKDVMSPDILQNASEELGAEARFVLARLEQQLGNRAKAIALAERSLEYYAPRAEERPQDLRDVRAWLAEVGAAPAE